MNRGSQATAIEVTLRIPEALQVEVRRPFSRGVHSMPIFSSFLMRYFVIEHEFPAMYFLYSFLRSYSHCPSLEIDVRHIQF